MNIPGFSNNGLKMMHEGIRNALAHDDALGGEEEKTYGVRESADWQEHANRIEAELNTRGASYTKIAW